MGTVQYFKCDACGELRDYYESKTKVFITNDWELWISELNLGKRNFLEKKTGEPMTFCNFHCFSKYMKDQIDVFKKKVTKTKGEQNEC